MSDTMDDEFAADREEMQRTLPPGPYVFNPEVTITMTEGKGWVWGLINDVAFSPIPMMTGRLVTYAEICVLIEKEHIKRMNQAWQDGWQDGWREGRKAAGKGD